MNAQIPLHHLAEFQRRTIPLLQSTVQHPRREYSALKHFP
jgi:hypothetical protein